MVCFLSCDVAERAGSYQVTDQQGDKFNLSKLNSVSGTVIRLPTGAHKFKFGKQV